MASDREAFLIWLALVVGTSAMVFFFVRVIKPILHRRRSRRSGDPAVAGHPPPDSALAASCAEGYRPRGRLIGWAPANPAIEGHRLEVAQVLEDRCWGYQRNVLFLTGSLPDSPAQTDLGAAVRRWASRQLRPRWWLGAVAGVVLETEGSAVPDPEQLMALVDSRGRWWGATVQWAVWLNRGLKRACAVHMPMSGRLTLPFMDLGVELRCQGFELKVVKRPVGGWLRVLYKVVELTPVWLRAAHDPSVETAELIESRLRGEPEPLAAEDEDFSVRAAIPWKSLGVAALVLAGLLAAGYALMPRPVRCPRCGASFRSLSFSEDANHLLEFRAEMCELERVKAFYARHPEGLLPGRMPIPEYSLKAVRPPISDEDRAAMAYLEKHGFVLEARMEFVGGRIRALGANLGTGSLRCPECGKAELEVAEDVDLW